MSVSTVSHVVNGTRYVSPEKVRKVEDAIRQLDELPNFIAKRSALKSKLSESRYVLILLSKKRSLFQNQVKEKLEEIVEQKGYIAISLAYDLDEDRLAAIRALAGTLDLAGMVAFPDREGVLSGAFFKGLRFPVVLIGNPVDRFAADTLLPDTFEGSYRAVRHLIKNGHERIAYLCELEVCGTQRFEGYRKALEDFGIALEKVLVRAGLKTEGVGRRSYGADRRGRACAHRGRDCRLAASDSRHPVWDRPQHRLARRPLCRQPERSRMGLADDTGAHLRG